MRSLDDILERLSESSLDGYGNWILGRLLEMTREIESQFERFEMHQLTHSYIGFSGAISAIGMSRQLRLCYSLRTIHGMESLAVSTW